jgi:hypothetical protein
MSATITTSGQPVESKVTQSNVPSTSPLGSPPSTSGRPVTTVGLNVTQSNVPCTSTLGTPPSTSNGYVCLHPGALFGIIAGSVLFGAFVTVAVIYFRHSRRTKPNSSKARVSFHSMNGFSNLNAIPAARTRADTKIFTLKTSPPSTVDDFSSKMPSALDQPEKKINEVLPLHPPSFSTIQQLLASAVSDIAALKTSSPTAGVSASNMPSELDQPYITVHAAPSAHPFAFSDSSSVDDDQALASYEQNPLNSIPPSAIRTAAQQFHIKVKGNFYDSINVHHGDDIGQLALAFAHKHSLDDYARAKLETLLKSKYSGTSQSPARDVSSPGADPISSASITRLQAMLDELKRLQTEVEQRAPPIHVSRAPCVQPLSNGNTVRTFDSDNSDAFQSVLNDNVNQKPLRFKGMQTPDEKITDSFLAASTSSATHSKIARISSPPVIGSPSEVYVEISRLVAEAYHAVAPHLTQQHAGPEQKTLPATPPRRAVGVGAATPSKSPPSIKSPASPMPAQSSGGRRPWRSASS